MNILIIEDNEFLAEKIKNSFEKNIILNRIKILHSYSDFINEIWILKSYDIILVDILLWNINDKNWIDIIKVIRKKEIKAPIVIMSNYSEISRIKKWFNIWANDYLIKPLRLLELEIRILKWFETYLSTIRLYNIKKLKYNKLEYNLWENEFYYKDTRIILSKRSKFLLSIFISKPEKLILETELIEKIWWDKEIINRNIRIIVLRLKKSLKQVKIDLWIKNIRWEWYILSN